MQKIRAPLLSPVELTFPLLLKLHGYVQRLDQAKTDRLVVYRDDVHADALRALRCVIVDLMQETEVLELMAQEEAKRLHKMPERQIDYLGKMLALPDEELHHRKCYDVTSHVYGAYRGQLYVHHPGEVAELDYWASSGRNSVNQLKFCVGRAHKEFGVYDLCISPGHWNEITRLDDGRQNSQWFLGFSVNHRGGGHLPSGAAGIRVAASGREITLWPVRGLVDGLVTAGPIVAVPP